MKIAILHHHLNRGGVTQVVSNHVRALQLGDHPTPVSEVLVLHGGRAEGWSHTKEAFARVPVETIAVDGLDYDDGTALRIDALADAISGTLRAAGFGPAETILHVHNHSLGKNVSLPGALRQLAERGYRLLLQIHDFAEDWRPANYRRFQQPLKELTDFEVGPYLYPMARQIHYAFLNTRDRTIFLTSNIAPEHVHLLPNPATAATTLPPHEEALQRFRTVHGLSGSQRLVLYPVRGIRRKNLGELLLWAAIADPSTTFALTLPATSHVEIPSFERWRRLAERLDLPVLFDVGLHEALSFEDNLAAADRILTTSVAEGFGLVFLEAWLHRRLLIGRNLPEITQDFRDRGLNLDHLGDALRIPLDWIGAEPYLAKALELHEQLCRAYGVSMAANSASTLRQGIEAGYVDFAALPTSQQSIVIQRASTSRQAGAEIIALNPWMRDALDFESDRWGPLIEANASAVGDGFSLHNTAADLMSVYGTLFAAPCIETCSQPSDDVDSLPEPDNILNAFLDISRLCPVRIEP